MREPPDRDPDPDESGRGAGEPAARRIPVTCRIELLRNENRQEILAVLRELPGLNKSLLSDEVDISLSLLDFHVRRLEQVGLVAVRKGPHEGERVCFIPSDVGYWENPRTRILFGRRPPRQVGLFLAENPGSTAKEIAQALSLAPTTVRYHLKTLRKHELVCKQRVGRRVVYHPRSILVDWVEEVGHGFPRAWKGEDADDGFEGDA